MAKYSLTTIYDTSLGFAENDGVAVQYQGKTYAADYTSNIGWTAEQEIKHWEIYLKKYQQPRTYAGCSVKNCTIEVRLL